MAGSEMWRLRPGQTLQYWHWDDEYVLYNDLSGDTHLLDDAAIEILFALKNAPASYSALAELMQAAFEIDEAALPAELRAILDHLKHLCLIESPAC